MTHPNNSDSLTMLRACEASNVLVGRPSSLVLRGFGFWLVRRNDSAIANVANRNIAIVYAGKGHITATGCVTEGAGGRMACAS